MSERKSHPGLPPLRVLIRPASDGASVHRGTTTNTGPLVNKIPERPRPSGQLSRSEISEKERHTQQVKELVRLCGVLRADLSLDEVLQQVVSSMSSCTGFRATCLCLLDPSGKTVHSVAMTGLSEEYERKLRETPVPVELMHDLMRPAFRISDSYFVPHDQTDVANSGSSVVQAKGAGQDAYQPGRWHPDDVLFVPLYSLRKQKLLGFLSLDDPEDGKLPTEEDIEVVELFANKAATAIDNARLYEEREMERIALTQGIVALREDLELMARGELQGAVRSTHPELKPVAETINTMVERQMGMFAEMQCLSQVVDDHMQLVLHDSEVLAQDARQQDIQVKQIAETINDFAVIVNTISERAANLSKTAVEAMDVTSDAQNKFDRAIEAMSMVRESTLQSARTMKALSESGQEISETITTMTDLTLRMHLLSLNAAIETSRAGEQGKGFAVIAQELRTLAMNSSEATRQISSYIQTIQQEATRVSQSVEQNTQKVVMQTELVMQTGIALDAIFVVIEQLTNLIQDICVAAENQSQGSEVVMNAVNEITHMTSDVTSHIREMQQSTSHLVSLSNSLRSQLSCLRPREA